MTLEPKHEPKRSAVRVTQDSAAHWWPVDTHSAPVLNTVRRPWVACPTQHNEPTMRHKALTS